MCRFVETIRLQNHELCNIALHQLRYENTARRFFDSGYALEDIAKVKQGAIPCFLWNPCDRLNPFKFR